MLTKDYFQTLAPNVRKISLIGGTGNGKTAFAVSAAAAIARPVLKNLIGDSNTSICDRFQVYTSDEAFKDLLLVAVKLLDELYQYDDFANIVAKSIAKTIHVSASALDVDIDKCIDVFSNELAAHFSGSDNLKASLSLLNEEQKSLIIDQLVDFYREIDFSQYNHQIYCTVKNSLSDTDIKKNSSKFQNKLVDAVKEQMDSFTVVDKEKIYSIYTVLISYLEDTVFTYFDKENLSSDGYFYRVLQLNDLDESDDDFIKVMFNANELRKGSVSIEVLCQEIVVYAPMHEKVADTLSSDDSVREYFSDCYGNFVFSILDTRGLLHKSETTDQTDDYCSQLFYDKPVDALALVIPLYGDPNEKKLNMFYTKLLKDFRKDIPMFLIFNKVDTFIFNYRSTNSVDDLFDTEPSTDELSVSDMHDAIFERVKYLSESLISAQTAQKGSNPFKSFVCYLSKNSSFPQEFSEEFNVVNVFKGIFHEMSAASKDTAKKANLSLYVGSKPIVLVDKAKLSDLVFKHANEPVSNTKTFHPGICNLNSNVGKTPHGNSYNALCSRLACGQGYNSCIRDDYFYNCESFSITFPANINNFLDDDFIHAVVCDTLQLDQVSYDKANWDIFTAFVENYMRQFRYKLSVFLLYRKALSSVNRVAFSFHKKFNTFLRLSLPYLSLRNLDYTAYTEAIASMIYDAAQKAITMNVRYI